MCYAFGAHGAHICFSWHARIANEPDGSVSGCYFIPRMWTPRAVRIGVISSAMNFVSTAVWLWL